MPSRSKKPKKAGRSKRLNGHYHWEAAVYLQLHPIVDNVQKIVDTINGTHSDDPNLAPANNSKQRSSSLLIECDPGYQVDGKHDDKLKTHTYLIVSYLQSIKIKGRFGPVDDSWRHAGSSEDQISALFGQIETLVINILFRLSASSSNPTNPVGNPDVDISKFITNTAQKVKDIQQYIENHHYSEDEYIFSK